jgi:hypothetical protein
MAIEIVKKEEWTVLTPRIDDPGAEGQFIFTYRYPVEQINEVRTLSLRADLGLDGNEGKNLPKPIKEDIATELWEKGKITREEILGLGGRIVKRKMDE